MDYACFAVIVSTFQRKETDLNGICFSNVFSQVVQSRLYFDNVFLAHSFGDDRSQYIRIPCGFDCMFKCQFVIGRTIDFSCYQRIFCFSSEIGRMILTMIIFFIDFKFLFLGSLHIQSKKSRIDENVNKKISF